MSLRPAIENIFVNPVVLLIFIYITLFSLAGDYGQSWDVQANDMNGNAALSYYQSGLDKEVFLKHQTQNDQFYGPIVDVLVVLLQGSTTDPVLSATIRNAVQFSISGTLIFSIYLILNFFVGKWPAAIGALVVFTTPSIFGHAFINPKDAPFAALYAWVVFFSIGNARREMPKWSVSILIGVLVGLAASIRFLGFFGIAIFSIALLANFVVKYGWRKGFVKTIASPHIYLAIASLVVIYTLTMPYILSNFGIQSYFEVIGKFSKYPWIGIVNYFGQWSSDALPWHYPIGMILAKMPLWFHFSIITIFSSVFWLLYSSIARYALASQKTPDMSKAVAAGILVISWLVPLAAFIFLHPVLYDGLRHFIFVVPLIAATLILAWIRVTGEFKGVAKLGAYALAAAFVLQQGVAIIRLHPYEYIYANPFVSARNNLELDYWATSFMEIAQYINNNEPALNKKNIGNVNIYVCGPGNSLSRYIDNGNYAIKQYDFDAEYKEEYLYVSLNRILGSTNCISENTKAQLLYSVRRGENLLSEIRLVSPDGSEFAQ